MGVQFGTWNIAGKPVRTDYIGKACDLIAPYGTEPAEVWTVGGISMAYSALPTTRESKCDSRSLQFRAHAVLAWDGRLDNRERLIEELQSPLGPESTDSSIVAAAYSLWGTDCFRRLIGDWALAIWDAKEQSLFLARDFAGLRPLYYVDRENEITWSTVLDPLILLAERTFRIEEEYIAGWLTAFPRADLTPYEGVLAVPPGSFVERRRRRTTIRVYWNFDPGKQIRYTSDRDYEAHFQSLFGQSVRRRLRSIRPILSELSGGMDSTAIVCMADRIGQDLDAGVNVETISYYNDSEPNWDERPYFTLVEQARGRTGLHVELDWSRLFSSDLGNRFYAIPADLAMQPSIEGSFRHHIGSRGFRVVLSGFGGDEILGGVPTPVPELADLLAALCIRSFGRKLNLWALSSRKSLLQLLCEVTTAFIPLRRSSEVGRPHIHWLDGGFVRRNLKALHGYRNRLPLFGARPSFVENMNGLESLRRQIGCFALPSSPPYEKRYPYLDRDLLEFIYAIPREQLIRPGERRSLMKRSLTQTVPPGVLERKRKSSISRAPHIAVIEAWDRLSEMSSHLFADRLGIVDRSRLVESLERARFGDGTGMIPLMRTILLEMWLTRAASMGLLSDGAGASLKEICARASVSKATGAA